ncbi:MAG: hypothetical protein JWQ87_2062 [Candidatus Sulfotelmatobacter sp.]|nr:hypothetical protein [Candidatus Sulfotelmatobacter sp.]
MHTSSHLAISRDGGVLLDIEHDRLLKLNTVGTEMWNLLSRGMTEVQVIETVAQRYGVGPLVVGRDLRALLSRLSELGLSRDSVLIAKPIETTLAQNQELSFRGNVQDPAPSRPIPATVDVVKAFLGLALFDVILSCRSLESLCLLVQSWHVKHDGAASKSIVVSRISAAVDKASVWYPKKVLCLQRSAVTACLLRESGIRAKMFVGIRQMPLLAHAWVEVDGSVVNDFPRVKIFYHSITSY